MLAFSRMIVISALALLVTQGVAAAQDAFGSSCQNPYRTELQVGPGASAGQPVRISLTASDLHPDYNWSSDGDDILVTDASGNRISHFVALWSQGAATGTIWAELNTGGAQTLYVYYGGAGANSNRNQTFDRGDGVEIHTRNAAAGNFDPASRAEAQARWDATSDGQSGWGIVTKRRADSIDGDDAPGNNGTSFAMKICTLFEVENNEVGAWDIRAYLDLGFGGDMRIDGAVVDSRWNDDLWWNNSTANVGEALRGVVSLQQGWHLLEVFGYEGCCDGSGAIYVDKPNTGLVVLDDGASGSSRTEMEIVSCEAAEVTVTVVASAACGANVSVDKSVEVLSNPVQTGPNPDALPGATVRYTLDLANEGASAVDSDTLVIIDALPANLKLIIQPADAFTFTDGGAASGLAFSYAGFGAGGDDVQFSTDGVSFNYTPTPDADGADPNITHIRFLPRGAFNGAGGGADPSFQMAYRAVLR